MKPNKLLNIRKQNVSLQELLSKELKCSKVLASILINRGIINTVEAKNFLDSKLEDLHDPFDFCDMQKSVELIQKRIKEKKKILICGDYDVDGVTSVALLKNTLLKFGIVAEHYLPNRIRDGYGLNHNLIEISKNKGISLVITADCGISGYDEIKALRDANIDVIITDHHEPQKDELPDANCIINPKVRKSTYKFKDLAGVGVAYKLCQALTKDALSDELDIVALGTIADVVPLKGENRILVKEGLLRLNNTKKEGIKALIEASRISGRQINTEFVSFILGPRINASGRVDSAEVSLNLLLSKTKEEAEPLAKTVDSLNRQRQKIEGGILEEANALIEKEVNFKDHQVIVVAREGWHHGVLGIVASKIADKFYRPTIVISLADRLCKGSGRSIKNFHLFDALLECKDFLSSFGGHSHAVGLNITKDNVVDFRKEINRLAKDKLTAQDLLPSIDVDMELLLSDLDISLVEEMKVLEPFGTGNTEPLFLTRNLKLKGQALTLARNTLKFWVTDNLVTFPVIGFGMSIFKESLVNCKDLSLVYSLKVDNWRGDNSFILEAKEIIFS